ncbi:MAG: HigA family addiction module antitoxin [Alkalispirochaeta sp.]
MADQPIYAQLEETEHPGEYLLEALESQEITQSQFARRAGISEKHVSQLVSGKVGMSAAMALAAERILGGSARLWLNLDTAHRLWVAKQERGQQEAAHTDWARGFPLKDLRARGFVSQPRVNGETVSELLSFFGVSGIEEWEAVHDVPVAQFRESPSLAASRKSQAAYLRICEIRAEVWDLAPYNREKVEAAVRVVRQNLHLDPPELLNRAAEELKEAGVALIVEPATEKSRLSGAAFWPRRNKAVLALTMRFKTADHLWFSFFHEVGHILLHRDRQILETPEATGVLEDEADRFAREMLIPPDAYRRLVQDPPLTEAKIVRAAEAHELPADSLVGMMQHDKVIDHGKFNHLKRYLQADEGESRQ